MSKLIRLDDYLEKFDFEKYEKLKVIREVAEEFKTKELHEALPSGITFDMYLDHLGLLKKK